MNTPLCFCHHMRWGSSRWQLLLSLDPQHEHVSMLCLTQSPDNQPGLDFPQPACKPQVPQEAGWLTGRGSSLVRAWLYSLTVGFSGSQQPAARPSKQQARAMVAGTTHFRPWNLLMRPSMLSPWRLRHTHRETAGVPTCRLARAFVYLPRINSHGILITVTLKSLSRLQQPLSFNK